MLDTHFSSLCIAGVGRPEDTLCHVWNIKSLFYIQYLDGLSHVSCIILLKVMM